MNTYEQRKAQDKRLLQIDRKVITQIFKAVKEGTGDLELALAVSIQLQDRQKYLDLSQADIKNQMRSMRERIDEAKELLTSLQETYYDHQECHN